MNIEDDGIKGKSRGDQWYDGLVVPWYVSFVVYMMVGVPLL
jgi:hypothetical protein